MGTIAAGRGKTRRTLPVSEVEIELATGSVDTVLRFAYRLVREVPMLVLPASKAARGDALASGAAIDPVKVELPAPHGSAPATAHLACVVAACQAALLANVHALIAAASAPRGEGKTMDDEFVHQARVAVRRMRSALRTFRGLLGARRYASLNERLREAGAMLGAARDWDVFSTDMLGRVKSVLAIDAAGSEAFVAVRATARVRRDAAHATLHAFVMSSEFARCALAVERFVLRIGARSGARSSPTMHALAAKLLDSQLRRVVAPARRIAALDETQRHRLRIEVKRLRYALDLFGNLYEAEAIETYRDALSALQDELGTLNDAAVALRMLQSLCGSEHGLPEESALLALAHERFAAWLATRTKKRLPKVGSLSVALELTPRPWAVLDGPDPVSTT